MKIEIKKKISLIFTIIKCTTFNYLQQIFKALKISKLKLYLKIYKFK